MGTQLVSLTNISVADNDIDCLAGALEDGRALDSVIRRHVF